MAFFPVVMPLCILPIIWAAKQAGMTGPGPGAPQNQGFPWGHFWFLYLLLVLYAVTLILRALIVTIDRRGSLRTLVDRTLHVALAYRVAPLLLAAPLAALLYRHALVATVVRTPGAALWLRAQLSLGGDLWHLGLVWLVPASPAIIV